MDGWPRLGTRVLECDLRDVLYISNHQLLLLQARSAAKRTEVGSAGEATSKNVSVNNKTIYSI